MDSALGKTGSRLSTRINSTEFTRHHLAGLAYVLLLLIAAVIETLANKTPTRPLLLDLSIRSYQQNHR